MSLDESCSAFPSTPREPIARRRWRCGITLVELLVTIAIIGLLMGLLLPAVQMAREAARRGQCGNNLRQMGVAAQLYHNAERRFPASMATWESWTWAFSLLPFVEQKALSDRWDRRGDFLSPVNLPLAAIPLPVFKCPTAISDEVYLYTGDGLKERFGAIDYKGCQSVNASDVVYSDWRRSYWLDGVVSRKRVGSQQIVDGLSQTLLLVESVGGVNLYDPRGGPLAYRQGIWFHSDGGWAGRALSGYSPTWQGGLVGQPACTINCTNMYNAGPYSFHPGGALIVMCDGSTHFLNETIDAKIVGAMYCYFEGQKTGEF